MIVIGVALCAAASFAQDRSLTNAPSVPSHTPMLVPGSPKKGTLAPHETITFALAVHAGLYNEVRVQQIAGMTQSFLIGVDGHEPLPHFNDGGTGSVERIPFIPKKSGPVYLRIESRERHAVATFQVTCLPERVPLPRDKDVVEAESALTEAEYARHRTGFHTVPKAQSPTYMLALYDRAYRLAAEASDVGLERQSLIGKARYQIFDSAEYQQGVRTARQATELPSVGGDPDQQALAWKTLASALAFAGRYQESIAASARAIALYKKTGDLYWQGIVLGNLADSYREIGDTESALKAADDALQLARQLSDDYGVAYTQAAIGEIYQERGQYQQALDAYDAALATANIVHYPQVEGEVRNDMGQVYFHLGDWERAKRAYLAALPVLQKDSDGIGEIGALDHLGEIEMQAGDMDGALRYFRKGLARAQGQKLVREETFLEIDMARACMQTRCVKDPLWTLSQARREAEKIHQMDGEAAAYAAIGDVLGMRQEDSKAVRAYVQSETLWQKIPNPTELAAVEAAMARLDARRDRLQVAKAEIFRAMDAIESSRVHINSDALRTSYFTSRHSYYDTAIDILMLLDSMSPHQGFAEQAWAVAERGRARTLLDELQEGGVVDAFAPEKKSRQQAAALEVKLDEAEGELSRIGASPADIARAEKLQRNIHNMLLEADQLQAHIRASDPSYRAVLERGRTAPDSLRRSVLRDDTALVEYWLGDAQSYLWTVTPSGIRSYQLPPRKALDGLVYAFQQSILARGKYPTDEDLQAGLLRIQKSEAHFSTQSQRLASILLPGPLPDKVHRLLIVADGSLLSVPFAALKLPSGNAETSKYLIEQYDLVYEPSESTAAALVARRAQHSGGARIAIFADPVYTITDGRVQPRDARQDAPAPQTRVLRQSSLESLSTLPRLPGSRKEAAAIAQIAGAPNTSMFLGFAASRKNVEAIDWKTYAAAHFATHAIVDTRHPEFSGIVLSMVRPNGAPADGVLWLHDIYRLDMPVSLVSLSGCETADGKSIPGEGINGLARAFLYAGARSVIGTLWNVDDSSSSELMQDFYRAFLTQHRTAAAALRAAQLHVMSDGDHQDPYYWAGFILEGDWQGW